MNFLESKELFLHIRCIPGRYPGGKPEMLEFAQMHTPLGYTVEAAFTNMMTRSWAYRLVPQPGFPELADEQPRGGFPDYILR